VLSVPKRPRYFLQNDPNALNTSLLIFLASSTATSINTVPAQQPKSIDALTTSVRALSSVVLVLALTHWLFHICVIDGVFEASLASGDEKGGNTCIIFHTAGHPDAVVAIAKVQSIVTIVRAFLKLGLLDGIAGETMIDAQ